MDPETAKQLIDAGKAILPEAYKDAIQPAAKIVGKHLEVIAKTVGIALAPLQAVVWGYERIREFIEQRVSEKLKNVPVSKLSLH